MVMQLPPVTRSRQLLVEGRDEELFFGAFLRNLQMEEVQVRNYQGKDNLRNYLEIFSGMADMDQVHSIGIVRDADDSAQSALQSVQGSLRNAGLAVPIRFVTPGEGPPRVSVFIMPDNDGSGALERLCLSTLADDPAMTCVEAFLTCVNARVSAPPQDQQKARIHAFLASREDPELRLGEAAQRGYIPWDHPAFGSLAQFLRDL